MIRRNRSASPRAKLSVSSTPDGVRQALEAFSGFSRSLALSPDAERRFLVAIDEILANIVTHARHDGPIGLQFSLTTNVLTVEIVDRADIFNPLMTAPPDVAAPLEARTPGGLGIAIVRGLMDRVVYERRAGRNRLTLTWRVRPSDAAPSGTTHAD